MPEPVRRDALTHGERLLVRAVRLLALQGGCEGLKGGFEEACGAAGVEVYRTLEVFVQQLRACGRRRVQLSAPAAPTVSADEAVILDVFGFAQGDDFRAMHDRLTRLVGDRPPTSLGAAAAWVGRAFEMGGLTLRASVDVEEAAVWLPIAAE
jgi:hypothetical protein